MMLYIIPYLFYSCLGLLGIFLQAEVFSFITIFGVKPDLLLIIALMAGIHSGRENGAVAGAILGFWADLLIGGFFGIHILVYAAMGYLFGAIGTKLNFKSLPGYFFATLLGGIISGIIFLVGYNLVGGNYAFWHNMAGIVIPYTFYNCLIIALLFPLIYFYRHFRGLKIGYVDMFGAGVVLITNNDKVNMDYVKKRQSKNKKDQAAKRRKTSQKHRVLRDEDSNFEDDHQQISKKKSPSNRRSIRDREMKSTKKIKKQKPTNRRDKSKKPRSGLHDE